MDVRDATRVYIACLEADEEKVRVCETLKGIGIDTKIKTNYECEGIRSYRVFGKKIERILNFKPLISIEESVKNMVAKIKEYEYTDFDNPRYYNIR